MRLDKRELGTVLAALRHYQTAPENVRDKHHIATDGGIFAELSTEEIDELCGRINAPEEETTIVVGLEGGLVQGASSNVDGINMIVLDYDTEGADDDEVTAVSQPGGSEGAKAVIGQWPVVLNSEWVADIVKTIGAADER